MMINTAGEVLTDNAPFTFPMLNMAADYAEKYLINRGVKTFVKETVLTPVLPVSTVASQPTQWLANVFISDVGYNDGNQNYNPPQLPVDLLQPTVLWERVTGSNAPGAVQEDWIPMLESVDGLRARPPMQRLQDWEWQTDAIYMIGATQSNDIRIRYESMMFQFVTPADSILVRGAQSALANLLAAVFVNSRNPGAGVTFAAAGDTFLDQIATMNTRARQRVTVTRQSYGNRTNW